MGSTFIISVVQRKGGVGKTTVAVNVAGELVRLGHSVTLIDADPQKSAFAWANPRRLRFPVRHHAYSSARIVTWIKAIYTSGTDVTIIDTPADLGSVSRTAIELSDLIIMPCGPSSLDINSAKQTLDKIDELSRWPGAAMPRIVIVPTRVDAQTLEGQLIAQELAELGHDVGPVLSYDTNFVRAFAEGLTVTDFAPGSAAEHEVRDVVSFMLAPAQAQPAM
jgi:chromosome partitioning protein